MHAVIGVVMSLRRDLDSPAQDITIQYNYRLSWKNCGLTRLTVRLYKAITKWQGKKIEELEINNEKNAREW